MTRETTTLALVVAVLLIGLAAFGLIAPSGPRSLRVFDPDRTADLELDMWRAYYDKRNARLFTDLVTLLHEQNRYSWGRATQAGFHLARAAATFGNLRSEYEQVLPDLIAAYTIERDWLHARIRSGRRLQGRARMVGRASNTRRELARAGRRAHRGRKCPAVRRAARSRARGVDASRACRQAARRRRRAGGLGDGVRLAAPVVSRIARGGAVREENTT